MGQNHYKYNKNYELEIDDELKGIINEELNSINNKNENKKFKKLINKKSGNKFKKSNFKKKFNSNKKGIKNVMDLLNLIYDKNIDREQKIKSNRTIHEILFDIRDAVELKNPGDGEYLENKNQYDKFKKKISITMESLLNPKNQNQNNDNFHQVKSLNYDNDINEREILFNENNNFDLSPNRYYNFENNNNQNFIIYENVEQPKDTDEIKPIIYNNLEKEEFLDNNVSDKQNIINFTDINNFNINGNNYYNNNAFLNDIKKPRDQINYNNENNNHIGILNNNNKQIKNIYNTNTFNYDNSINKYHDNIKTFNYDNNNSINNNKYSYINDQLELPKKQNNNIETLIYNNKNKKNDVVIYNNFRPVQRKKINNIKRFNFKNNKENTNNNDNNKDKNNNNKINNDNTNQNIQTLKKKETNLIIKNSNSFSEIEKNNKDNKYIYNKKNINKKVRTYSYDLQKNNNLNDYYKEDKKRKNNKNIFEKESKISLNITPTKNKNKKNLKINNSKNKQICKNEEIFFESSPNIKNNCLSNSYNKNKTKYMDKDLKINKNFFTVINEMKSKENDIINENNNVGYKNIYLRYIKNEINKKKNNQKNNIKLDKIMNKTKTKSNIKNKKHSKIPKKQPVVNIKIDLKDLIKQDNMEKCLDNTTKIEKQFKKTKECFDYPEDLKYNVFGKQYKFSYHD